MKHALPVPVRVSIDVLLLEDVSSARGSAVGAALRTELARLLGSEAAQAQLRRGAKMPRVEPAMNGGVLELPARERAERTGGRIAARVADVLLARKTSR